MLLKLSLPKGKIIWALAHPVSKEYIHSMDGVGYQECSLIVTEKQPVEVKLEKFPKWAQTMILTSITKGELINSGDSINQPKEETLTSLETKEQPSKTKKSGSKKLKMDKDV